MSGYKSSSRRRKNLRKRNFAYSQVGYYFITICIKNRRRLFGNVVNENMILNPAGQMVRKWYYELENKFPDIRCREMVVMPDHIHCIIENVGTPDNVSFHKPNGPQSPVISNNPTHESPGADPRVCPDIKPGEHVMGDDIPGEHGGSPMGRVVQWFKTMTTNEYIRGVKKNGWPRFDGKLWQRNYWERFFSDDNAFENISEYIINNPRNWYNGK